MIIAIKPETLRRRLLLVFEGLRLGSLSLTIFFQYSLHLNNTVDIVARFTLNDKLRRPNPTFFY
jgi:hypothetical protein